MQYAVPPQSYEQSYEELLQQNRRLKEKIAFERKHDLVDYSKLPNHGSMQLKLFPVDVGFNGTKMRYKK